MPSFSISYPIPNDERLRGVFGVDGLRLTTRLFGEPKRFWDWRASAREGPGWRSLRPNVGRTAIYVAAGSIEGVWWCTVDFNPARIVDPAGWAPCPTSELRAATERVWAVLLRHVETSPDPSGARVKRIDVTRDFLVENPAPYILGLQQIPRAYATKNHLYVDPRTGAPQGLEIGSRSGGRVVLYDKGAESSVAPAGTLRWESQNLGWAKRYGGIERLAAADETHVASLGLDRFRWSKVGQPIRGVRDAVSRTVDLTDSWPDAAVVVGFALLQGSGYSAAGLPKRLASVADEIGVAWSRSLLESDDSRPSVRLDLLSGTEVHA